VNRPLLAFIAIVVATLVPVASPPRLAHAADAPPAPPSPPRRHGLPTPPAGMDEPPPPTPGPTPTPNASPSASPDVKPVVDWSGQTGKLKFVIGFDVGMDKAWMAGSPAMLYFTSAKSPTCINFGRRTWANEEVTDKLIGYLPVLVDADAEADAKKAYGVTTLPTLVWVDYEGAKVFVVEGDGTLEDFGEFAETARTKAPPVKPRDDDLKLLERVRADMSKSLEDGRIAKAISAATALSVMKRPKAASDQGKAALADLDAKGRARLVAAAMVRSDGKLAEAKAEFEKLAADYRGRDVGRGATAFLREMEAAANPDK
jgi:hypothetical protein